jgi:hypothetical protein
MLVEISGERLRTPEPRASRMVALFMLSSMLA